MFQMSETDFLNQFSQTPHQKITYGNQKLFTIGNIIIV